LDGSVSGDLLVLPWVWQIWAVADIIGIGGTFVLVYAHRRRAPVISQTIKKIDRRIFWFWFLLFIYADVWLVILYLRHGLQLNAFLVTLIMFAYITLGRWLQSPFMIGLGLTVTALTLLGFIAVWFEFVADSNLYNLWMAVVGGGALLVIGLYMRLRWR
jgi:hypothetical protein